MFFCLYNFCHGYADAVFHHHHFTTGNKSVIYKNIDWLTNFFIKLDNCATP